MKPFDTDRQATQAAKDYSRGQASPNGASAAHGRAALKFPLRIAVKRMRNGMALQLPPIAADHNVHRFGAHILFTLLAIATFSVAQEKYIRRSLEEKTSAKDLTFLAAFDKHDINAAFAKGGREPLGAMKDVSLLLRGLVGFDGEGAFTPEPGEKLRYPVVGNVDPHKGTLILWTAGLDYNPCDEKTDGKARGNVCLAHLMFTNGERNIEYKLYEYAQIVYFDWWTNEPPKGFGQNGRVYAPRDGIRKGQWHQIAVTWDDVEIAIYLNGEHIMSKALPMKVAKLKDIVAEDNADSFIGVKSPFYEDKHSYAVGIDDFAIYSRPFSALEIKNQYLSLLKDKGEQKILPYSISFNGVNIGKHDKLDKVEVELDLSSLPPADKEALGKGTLKMDYTLEFQDGKSVAKGTWNLRQTFETFVLPGVATPGKYTLKTKTPNAVLDESFEKPDMSWVGNGLGEEDEVPEIWKDFAVDGRKVTLWNRTYIFGDGPLPEKILVYGGKELLSRRPRLLIDGKEPSWKGGKIDKHTRWVDYHCTGTLEKAKLSCVTRIEFDGLIKFDWTIDGKPEISTMEINWQLAPENRQFLMTPHVYEGKEPQVELPYPKGGGQGRELWMVAEKKGGFAYAMVNDANWIYDADKPVLFANLETGDCRVTMITNKVSMPAAVPYEALFIATPTRPLPAENRVIKYSDSRGKTKTSTNGGGNGGFRSIFTHAPHETDFAYRRKAARPNTQSVYGGVALTDMEPFLLFYKKYWEIPGSHTYNMPYERPVGPGKYEKERHASVSVCTSTVVSDYFLWCQKLLYDHPLSWCIWQVYYDLCGNSLCRNAHHGCAFKDKFGRDIASFVILHKRDLVLRTVAYAHKHGKTLMVHAQRDFFPMMSGLADYYFPGEQYNMVLKRNPYGYTDEISDHIYRAEFNRNVLGIGVVHLPALGQADFSFHRIPEYTEAMLCMLQSHDIETTQLYACGGPVQKLWDIMEKYGLQSPDVVCHLYHENHAIRSSAPSLRVTWYECPDKRYLLFLANKDVMPLKSTIDVSAIAGGDFMAYEEYREKDVPVNGGKFDITVPGRSFSVVCFPPKLFYPHHDSMDNLWSVWQGKSDSEFTISKDGGVNASPCLLMKTKETGGGCFMGHFSIKPGRTYTYKVMARRNNLEGDLSLGIQARIGGALRNLTPVATRIKASTEWHEIVLTYTVPTEGPWSECDNVLMTLGGKGANSELFFDDLSIEESYSPTKPQKKDVQKTPPDILEDAFDNLKSWGFWKLEETKVAKSHDAIIGRNAPGAACITVEDGNTGSGCFTRRLSVTPGKEYNFIVFAKADALADDTTLSLGIQGLDKNKNFLGTPVHSVKLKASECRQNWQRLVLSFKIPETGKWNDCALLLITLGTGGKTPGKAYFDDFQFFVSKH